MEHRWQDVILNPQCACSRCQKGRRCQYRSTANAQSSISDRESGLCLLIVIWIYVDDVSYALSLKLIELLLLLLSLLLLVLLL